MRRSIAKTISAALGAVLLTAGLALAQDSSNGGATQKAGTDDAGTGGGPAPVTLETSPFAPPKPGQTQTLNAPVTPKQLRLGLLHWFPIASRCTFVDPDRRGEAPVEGAPEPFVFVTMVEEGRIADAPPGLERGYVMANGIVRELEKGKTSATKDGEIVTVWRSAGEPRINVNVVISGESRAAGKAPQYQGSLTVFWGDKKETAPIVGACNA